jgi:hypothetical protein
LAPATGVVWKSAFLKFLDRFARLDVEPASLPKQTCTVADVQAALFKPFPLVQTIVGANLKLSLPDQWAKLPRFQLWATHADSVAAPKHVYFVTGVQCTTYIVRAVLSGSSIVNEASENPKFEMTMLVLSSQAASKTSVTPLNFLFHSTSEVYSWVKNIIRLLIAPNDLSFAAAHFTGSPLSRPPQRPFVPIIPSSTEAAAVPEALSEAASENSSHLSAKTTSESEPIDSTRSHDSEDSKSPSIEIVVAQPVAAPGTAQDDSASLYPWERLVDESTQRVYYENVEVQFSSIALISLHCSFFVLFLSMPDW